MTTLNETENRSEFKYRMRIRPFGIGCQPAGHLRHEEDGSQFGVVVYDHKLSRKEVENFTLAPLTEADELKGNVYEVQFGSTKAKFCVVCTDNAVIDAIINNEYKMSFPYYKFMDMMAKATLVEC